MEVLKFDINIPFWCSFKEFGTVNSHLTYTFPPPPTLFGLILNALGKPSLHTICNEYAKQKLEAEYFNAYKNIRFSIIVRAEGIKIDDYSNILKRNRGSDNLERHIPKKFTDFLKYNIKLSNDELVKQIVKECGKYKVFREGKIDDSVDRFSELTLADRDKIKEFLYDFWGNDIAKYDISKYWQKTQVTRQRIVKASYSVFMCSENNEEYSLEAISEKLKNPQRPLYCGESDDLVELFIYDIEHIHGANNKTNRIHSVLPGVYSNSTIVNIPIALRNQPAIEQRKVCSIPIKKIEQEVDCFQLGEDNFVFI